MQHVDRQRRGYGSRPHAINFCPPSAASISSPNGSPKREFKGSKNRKTLEREKVKKITAARAELAKNAPPIDFAASFDSLDIMEKVMRHFYLRALIEERMSAQADWSVVDALMLKTLAAAEKVARYRHAQFSAVRLAGDINAKNYDHATLDELLAKLNAELGKLGPLINLDAIREPQGVD
jgi:hypothetical protein